MTAVEAPALDVAHGPAVQRRISALAAGLQHLGPMPGHDVLIVTCASHDTDRVVAEWATRRVDLVPECLDPGSARLDAALADRPALVLACTEGSSAVAATSRPCRIFGDLPGIGWWRMLESKFWLTGEPAPRTDTRHHEVTHP